MKKIITIILLVCIPLQAVLFLLSAFRIFEVDAGFDDVTVPIGYRRIYLPIFEIDHIYVRVPDRAPSCEEPGYSDTMRCIICDRILVGWYTSPTGHDSVITVYETPSTCVAPGTSLKEECATCGKVLKEQEALTPTWHNVVSVKGEYPTCTEVGFSDFSYCSVCNMVLYARRVIPAYGHDYVNGVCRVCGENENG